MPSIGVPLGAAALLVLLVAPVGLLELELEAEPATALVTLVPLVAVGVAVFMFKPVAVLTAAEDPDDASNPLVALD